MRENATVKNTGTYRRDQMWCQRMRARRNRMVSCMAVLVSALCLTGIFTFSYGVIRTDASSGFKYYTQITVEQGESLWNIAEEYIDYDYYSNIKSYVKEVCRINHLSEDGRILAGQKLIVPYYSSEYVY